MRTPKSLAGLGSRLGKPLVSVIGFAGVIVVAVLPIASRPVTSPSRVGSGGSQVVAVGAENEYANVISQIGGRLVKVASILDNPNTDPHTFESSVDVEETVASAALVVQNGLGYDDFMTTIENAAPNANRKVIDVQKLLGLPDSTPNPHLWYNPVTMPKVAAAVESDLAALSPKSVAYLRANLARFDASLAPWQNALANFKKHYAGTTVAVTEPVGDYMLQAAGTSILTPFSLQAAIMNGTDPSPEDVSIEESLFKVHKVKVFVYNQQVTDSLTQTFLNIAKSDRIPVVGVYETMPTPGYDYQTWMVAEVNALREAVADGVSTAKL